MKAGSLLPLEISLLFILFLAPIAFGSVYPWASMFLAAFLFFLCFCYPEAISKVVEIPRFFSVGMLLVFIWICLQLFFLSLNRYSTGTELLKWLALAAGFLLIQCLTRNALFRLACGIAFLGFFESLYGLFQTLQGREMVLWQIKEFHRGFVTGTYLNRNHFAGMLELCLGIHLGLLLWAWTQRKVKIIFG